MIPLSKPREPFSGEHALRYDANAAEGNWLDPDILFGLAFRYTVPGESVLDVGIGTGLASFLFHKAGMNIIGLDRSRDMLAVCKEKGLASELIQHDISVAPYPLEGESVDHAVCAGVLHCFEDLSVLLGEVGRVLRKGGTFVFGITRSDAEGVEALHLKGGEGRAEVTLYLHSLSSITSAAERCGFEVAQSLRYTAAAVRRTELNFLACVLRKS